MLLCRAAILCGCWSVAVPSLQATEGGAGDDVSLLGPAVPICMCEGLQKHTMQDIDSKPVSTIPDTAAVATITLVVMRRRACLYLCLRRHSAV
jgi:hypothetical protein